MSKTWTNLLLAVALTTACGLALAHGDEQPKRGGTVSVAEDLAFELVPQPNGAGIYIEDHGKPALTQGMTGKLTVLNGADKAQVELIAAGDNVLEAKGVRIAVGTKAVAAVTLRNAKTLTVRFTVK